MLSTWFHFETENILGSDIGFTSTFTCFDFFVGKFFLLRPETCETDSADDVYSVIYRLHTVI
jgi:hypothetical protein